VPVHPVRPVIAHDPVPAPADLTDPANGLHAIQLIIGEVVAALRRQYPLDVRVGRASPQVSVADNYDVLGYTPDAVTRDTRYTRYVGAGWLLRTHTSAMVPPVLRGLASESLPSGSEARDVLVVCPGIVHRRDCVDRLHTGTPHQLDLWRIAESVVRLRLDDLHEMIAVVVEAALPGHVYRTTPAVHPYTLDGMQIDVQAGPQSGRENWVEIGECGLAYPDVLARCGLDPDRVSGLALGMGVDRLVMVRKRINDIRLLRSPDPRVVAQMGNLAPYRQVSACPAIVRDLSLAVDEHLTAEELGDRVRSALGDDVDKVEEVRVVSETPLADLPDAARERLGIRRGQKNVLVRVVLRRLDRALMRDEANALRDAIAACLHQGDPG
jgi:phenylalanyl-tRNA synthetase alpha chain